MEGINNTEKFIESPIALNNDLELTNDDIERKLAHNEVPKNTLLLKQKEGFPSYCVFLESRILLIIGMDLGYKAFVLKEDSQFLAKYKEKYGGSAQ